jgi:hypothetical protein
MDEPVVSPELISRLSDALRHQRAYQAIYQHYMDDRPREDFLALLNGLNDDSQDMVESLATALRQAGESPLGSEPPDRLLTQGWERKGTLSRLQFMLVGVNNTIQFLDTQLAGSDPQEIHDLWAELLALARKQEQAVKNFLSMIEHAQ